MTDDVIQNLRDRIHQFDKVVRSICEELEMDYAGVDCDDGSIVMEIRRLKLRARLAGRRRTFEDSDLMVEND